MFIHNPSTPAKVSPLIFIYMYAQFKTCDALYLIWFHWLLVELHWECVDFHRLELNVQAVAILFLPSLSGCLYTYRNPELIEWRRQRAWLDPLVLCRSLAAFLFDIGRSPHSLLWGHSGWCHCKDSFLKKSLHSEQVISYSLFLSINHVFFPTEDSKTVVWIYRSLPYLLHNV